MLINSIGFPYTSLSGAYSHKEALKSSSHKSLDSTGGHSGAWRMMGVVNCNLVYMILCQRLRIIRELTILETYFILLSR